MVEGVTDPRAGIGVASIFRSIRSVRGSLAVLYAYAELTILSVPTLALQHPRVVRSVLSTSPSTVKADTASSYSCDNPEYRLEHATGSSGVGRDNLPSGFGLSDRFEGFEGCYSEDFEVFKECAEVAVSSLLNQNPGLYSLT